ncbi:MAG: DNA replication protein [Rhodospirillales bacterium RIFCSPLOWO2_12_FULL_58_28]|nr:MAG: DNA replication protein [Rhodospirillales bacterium RIFCSPLOWO2_02_FULL_58_16]OHC78699.1 MAG: DNA replication protein [Rhodospirillales bacterium RIFCSPLOWO2_12_FULL_58_28]
MTSLQQLPLDFDHRTAFSGDDFLVAPCNRQAVDRIDCWPEWSAAALIVHGPAGCGKTHLARVFMAKSGAAIISPEDLAAMEPPELLGDHRACVIEDADSLSQQEEHLLHLYNTAQETGRRLLLTASQPPTRWNISLADLRSRLIAAPTVEIGPPDDALIAAVLVKLFADRQLKVDIEVINFMLTHMERSFEAARRLVGAVDETALAERRNITVPLTKQVLRKLEGAA